MTSADQPVPGLSIVNLFAVITDAAARLSAGRPTGFVPVHGSSASGRPLLSNGSIGADLIVVPPGESFPVHTHDGHHLLHCVGGDGTISVDGVAHPVRPGDVYLIDAARPHAVGAGPHAPHMLVSIGAPHTPIDSPARMTPTDWAGAPVAETPVLPDE